MDAFHRALHDASSPTLASLHVRTIEALVNSTCKNPFAETVCFRHQPWDFGSYGFPPSSGKSVGVLGVCLRGRRQHPLASFCSPHRCLTCVAVTVVAVAGCAELCPNGPHHFGRVDQPADGEPIADGGSATLPHGAAVILHYESGTYARWRDKFSEIAASAENAAKAAK